MFLEGQVDRQTDRQTGAQTADAKTISLRLQRGKPVLSTGYLVSCSRTQHSASGEARTRNPSISGQVLYHDCAPQLGSILCRYDTCPTQYAPDLRGSILCMQGTQYAPRESILCMEHFVALQCSKVSKRFFWVPTTYVFVEKWENYFQIRILILRPVYKGKQITQNNLKMP